jgi:hypothetical protein
MARKRWQRFIQALDLIDLTVWDPVSGLAYKRFLNWSFDVNVANSTEFLAEDVLWGGKFAFQLPTKRVTFSVTNHQFELQFLYVVQDFAGLLSASPDESSRVSINVAFQVDDEDAFDYWLDERIFLGDFNLCTPEQTVDPLTGIRETRISVQGSVVSTKHKPGDTLEVKSDAGSFAVSPDGSIMANLNSISKISVDNINALVSYSLIHSEERTFHVIDYVDGGQAEVTYGQSGKIETFRTERVAVRVNNNTEIVLAYEKPSS